MERNQEIVTMLYLMSQPAFVVQDGVICHVNAAASIYLLQENMPIAELLATGSEDYQAFQRGTLYLGLRLEHLLIGASVTCVGAYHLFTLEQASAQDQLQVLALAAQQLRTPLTSLMISTDQLAREQHDRAASVSRSVHQLHRIISNMSDAHQYAQPGSDRREYCDIVSILQEILNSAQFHLQDSAAQLRWELPDTPLFTMVDRDQLERAVLNMLSNAIKFSANGSLVSVQLKVVKKRLRLSVTSESTITQSNMYQTFQRQPGIEDPRHGLGLGMVLVRSMALNHGGAVLTDQPQRRTSRITLTLPVCSAPAGQLRSPLLQVDYACQQDRCLLELSEVLPLSAYQEST